MRRLIAIVLALVLVLSLVGCGENKPPQTEPTVPTETEEAKESTATPSSSAETTEPASKESSAEETTVPVPTESSAELPTETEPAPAERTVCTAKLLEDSMNDEKAGLTYQILPDIENVGPTEFAVIGESSILILDAQAFRLQHYKDGQYFETISLPQKYYFRLCVMGENAYLLEEGGLLKIDLNTKAQSAIPLPYVRTKDWHFILEQYDENLFEEDGKLYLVTREHGSFCLNEATQSFEQVSSNATYAINRSEDGKEILVTKGDRSWTIEAENCEGNVIGFEDDVLYFWLRNPNLIPGGDENIDPDYERCHILKCAAGEDDTEESFVYGYLQGWGMFPWCFAKVAPDGSVYVLALYEESFAVYKLKVGAEDIVSP